MRETDEAPSCRREENRSSQGPADWENIDWCARMTDISSLLDYPTATTLHLYERFGVI